MSDTKEFEKLVDLDMLGTVSEEASKTLRDNLERWKDELVRKLRGIEKQLTDRRAFSFREGTHEARVAYETWKKSALGYKRAITDRLCEIKASLREKNLLENVDRNDILKDKNDILEDILDELKAIRWLMKEKGSKVEYI
jgi:hypothetical protein